MKKALNIKRFGFAAIMAAIIGFAAQGQTQIFSEDNASFRTDVVRAKGLDTIRIERHSFISLPELNDEAFLTYHEPYPDKMMPKSAIDLGTITIQAESADEVIEILEEQAREMGADWIIGFNEPRIKRIAGGDFYYRSEARLFRVLDEELIAENDAIIIAPSEQRINDYASLMTWFSNYVTRDEED